MSAEKGRRTVLVINAGSSSLKYQLVDPDSGKPVACGVAECIGESSSSARLDIGSRRLESHDRLDDHEAALRVSFDLLRDGGIELGKVGLAAVGHRVVHGGQMFYRPSVVDDAMIDQLKTLSPLAPLHNPPAILGIEVARRLLPAIAHVAVFDTAFFHHLPPAAATYAIDRELANAWQIRRYGFHGTSHCYVSEQAAVFLGRPLAELNQIVLHLGNGSSASAIAGGRPVDTSMGLTPLEGLVMGTRSGDVDPSVIGYLCRSAKMSIAEVDSMLNRRSGVLGLCGENDFRRLHEMTQSGDSAAQLAYDVFIHRLRKYIGAYLAVLGHTDVVTFTAGIGENDPVVRRDALAGMSSFGIEVDENGNTDGATGARRISATDSPVAVLVIPTNEELAIARDCLRVI